MLKTSILHIRIRNRIFQLVKPITFRRQWVERLSIMETIEKKYVEKVYLYEKYLFCLEKSKRIYYYMCYKTKYINTKSIHISLFPLINFHWPMTLVNIDFHNLTFDIYFCKYTILYFTNSVIETKVLYS